MGLARDDTTHINPRVPEGALVGAPSSAEEPWFLGPGWRLFGALWLTLVLPTALFVLLVFTQARLSLKEQAVQQNALAAQLASQAVQEHFTGMAHYLESFAGRRTLMEAIQRRDRTTLQAHLRELVTQNLDFDRALVVDAQGVEWCDYPSTSEAEGKNFSPRDWYQGVSRTRQSYVSEIYPREDDPRHFLMAIATPVRNAEGGVLAYLVGQHTIESLSAWLAQIRPPFPGSLVLIDQRGNVASRVGRVNDPPINVSRDPLIQKVLADGKGSVEAPNPITGEKSLVSYIKIKPFEWSVLSIQSLDGALLPLRKLRDPFLILTLAFLSGLFILHAWALHLIRRYHLAEKEAKTALQGSEKRLKAVVETAHDAIISANQFGEIVFWNKWAETMFGYPADAVAGKPLTLLMPERFHEPHRAGLARFVLTAESRIVGRTVELVGLRKNGSEFPLEISLSHWMLRDEHYFTAIVRDITERKRSGETVVQKNLALEKVSQELRERTERLQRFHNLTVDRELEMRRLKEEVNALLERLGQPKKY